MSRTIEVHHEGGLVYLDGHGMTDAEADSLARLLQAAASDARWWRRGIEQEQAHLATIARLEAICGQVKVHADLWECDLADVERFRTLAREYMDERDEALRWEEKAAADENANAKDLRAALDAAEVELAFVLAWLRRPHHPECDWSTRPAGSPACTCGQWLVDERANGIATGRHRLNR